MRYLYQGVSRDGNGRVIASATVTVYLANSSTLASVYTSLTSTTVVNSVGSSSDGSFSFYHDRGDYDFDQLFKIVISRGGFTSATYDYVRGKPILTSGMKGKAILVAGTVTVSTVEIKTSDYVQLTRMVLGGTPGHLSVGTITNEISFVINSSSNTDTSTIYWQIMY